MSEREAAAAAIRVLLADDDEGYLASLQPLIDGVPELIVVGAATNGRDAIELAGALEPHAAVIDLHMPLLDGVATVTQLRRAHPHLCLIVLTGDSTPELHERVRGAGADAVLLKSDMLDGLMDRLSAAR